MIKARTLLSALALAATATSALAAARPPIRVILVGDSTMATDSGYGDALCARFTPEVTCINLGAKGRSSRTFRAEGRWDQVQRMLRDGGKFSATYVLVQFGHNDQPGKRSSTDLVTQFPANMERYARQTKELGGVPVLVTPLTRRTFKGPYLHDSLGPWAEATREVAARDHDALLDLNADSAAAIQKMGRDEADTLAVAPPPPGIYGASYDANNPVPATKAKSKFDWTHLGPKGAAFFSAMVAGELKKAVPAIAPYLKKD
jgi:lysophospholipase L1-like esterase